MSANRIRGTEDLRRLNLWRRHQSTLSLVLCAAASREFPKKRLRIEHSMSKGFYCTIDTKIDAAAVRRLERTMKEIIKEDVPIQRADFPVPKARYLFNNMDQPDKVALLKNIRKQQVTLYSLLDFYDMYAISPLESTGQARIFYLRYYAPGFIMVFPTWQDLSKLPAFVPQPRLSRIFNEYLDWAKILGMNDLGPLNAVIKKGRGPEIIKIVEALHEKKVAQIADRIARSKRRIALIAGPSSAGKTTFTKRLAIQLIVNGLRPLAVSIDDYFYPHSKTPVDASGKLDFESVGAVDVGLLNEHLVQILKGKTVTMPRFNFVTGRSVKGRTVAARNYDVILLEGIHCLNNALTPKVPAAAKFKIYISALTQLNIDDHNRISTTDTRLIRRLVRDTHFRGYNVEGVLRLWPGVIRGEENNIYPYQEEADEMFNSALIYEPSVLKRFCTTILRRVRKDAAAREEASRLLDFLNLFHDLPDRDVPFNSILREFIGGSSFLY